MALGHGEQEGVDASMKVRVCVSDVQERSVTSCAEGDPIPLCGCGHADAFALGAGSVVGRVEALFGTNVQFHDSLRDAASVVRNGRIEQVQSDQV